MNKRSAKKSIFLVDDEHDNNNLIFTIGLQDAGFEVDAYTDAELALSSFKPDYYDLLLLDIKMPMMDGFELCTKISEVDLNVKICFITAGDINIDGLREVYPTLSTECFIKNQLQ
jgi:DNA-binding response OmpR family regulator